jgi:hypothetical protein
MKFSNAFGIVSALLFEDPITSALSMVTLAYAVNDYLCSLSDKCLAGLLGKPMETHTSPLRCSIQAS